MCVEITSATATIIATVVDECPISSNSICGSQTGHLDLSMPAAVALGMTKNGNPTNVTWKSVACPVSGPIVASFNSFSSQVFFQNVTFPVASATAGGHTGTLRTNMGGYWDFGTNVAGMPVMLTDALGHTAAGTIPSSSGGGAIGQGSSAQFAATCQ